MFNLVIKAAVFVLFAALLSCGRPTILAESTPRPADASSPTDVSPPAGTFSVPISKAEWMPVSIGSGLGGDLVQALVDHESVALILQANAPALLEDRVFQMVRASAPDIKVVARGRATLDTLLEERGEVPYRVTLEPAGVDHFGRPYYLPKEHPLFTDWLANKKPLKGAEAILTVRRIRVDDIRLRQLREGRIGSCEAFEAGLQSGLDHGAQFFKPYSDFVNDALKNAFSRHLEAAIPYWREELKKWSAGEAFRCRSQYESFIDEYESCVLGSCASGPSFFASSGGVIGMVDNTLLIPKTCPIEGMRDYTAEMEDLAGRAVAEVLPVIDRGWIPELMKAGAFEEFRRGIKKACTPRRRRIDGKKLAMLRSELDGFLSMLMTRELSGEWTQAEGMERVSGVGPVRILARVAALGHNPVASARELMDGLRSLDKCDEGKERFYQATLINVGTSEVKFMGIFFEEELLCDGFPPASPSF